ncbi:hypothetical protein EDB86DRAFT_3022825 [Lactarius hatsudake]|nr:hypothetical protein EDB86DRAFT_3022825 [Lactarius hatsudake]
MWPISSCLWAICEAVGIGIHGGRREARVSDGEGNNKQEECVSLRETNTGPRPKRSRPTVDDFGPKAELTPQQRHGHFAGTHITHPQAIRKLCA